MGYDFSISVVIVCYNPNYTKLIRTVHSVIMQEGIDFDIVVADDGSEEDFFPELKEFFESNHVNDYTFVKNSKNVGTVKNFLSGIKMAKGSYIRPISPGDFLYSRNTLSDIYHFMREKKAGICFGNAAYFNIEDHRIRLVSILSCPQRPEIYTEKPYNPKKVKRYYLIYSDMICGICFAWANDVIKKYLELIDDKIIYAEDNILRIAVTLEERISYMDNYVVWYEYGTGISTDESKRKVWDARLIKDFNEAIAIIHEQNPPDDFTLKSFFLLNSLLKRDGSKKNKLLRYLIRPDLLWWRLRKKRNTNEGDLDLSNLLDIVNIAGNPEEICSIE